MYTLFIADDEAIMRESLGTYIPWEKLGFEVAGIFEDGESLLAALGAAALGAAGTSAAADATAGEGAGVGEAAGSRGKGSGSSVPDVVLTDIRMGAVSGIDVARRISEAYPDCKVVLISGFQDFEYARSAIRYGVFSFISKPASIQEICEEFTVLKKHLDGEKRRLREIELSRRDRDSLKDGLRRLLLTELIRGGVADRAGLDDFAARSGTGIETVGYPLGLFLFSGGNEASAVDDFDNACAGASDSAAGSLEDYFDAVSYACGTEDGRVRFALLSRKAIPADTFSDLIASRIEALLERISAVSSSPFEIQEAIFYDDAEDYLSDSDRFPQASRSVPPVLPLHLDAPDPQDPNSGERDIVGEIIAHIRQRYASDLSLTTIADAVALNPIYISRLFKEKTGVNFIDYVTDFRMGLVQRLLKDPQVKVYEAGEQVGYRNVKYFYKLFKRVTGMTPTEFREREGIVNGEL